MQRFFTSSLQDDKISSFWWLFKALYIRSAINSTSFSFMPLVVIPGVPILTPEAIAGGWGSKGIAFLFVVIPASDKAFSASFPVSPDSLKS